MSILASHIIASLLQLHGPDATVQSDHRGIDALLGDVRGQISRDGADLNTPEAADPTQVAFRRGAFAKGHHGGAFRRATYAKGYHGGGAFRRGAFRRV